MNNDFVMVLVCFVVSFAIGSIPWGVIISKLFYNKDVRESGSGNIGFTNSMRAMGKIGGGAVFLLDFAKGLCSALLAAHFLPSIEFATSAATFAAVAGHIFCPWLNFRGGKGISTAFGGSFVALSPICAIILFAIFLVIVLVTKYVSAGSITVAFLYPFFGIFTHQYDTLSWIFFIGVGVFVIWAHRDNIKRIISRSESKISDKRKKG